MFTISKSILLTASIAAASVSAGAEAQNFKLNFNQLDKSPQLTLPRPPLLAPELMRVGCVDLAVTAEQSLVGDRILVTYQVRNVSDFDYISKPSQQAIVFSGPDVAPVNNRFTSLDEGHSLHWSEFVPKPLEFPNSYSVVFSHDPDLYIDGNTANDDCVRTNNRVEVAVYAS